MGKLSDWIKKNILNEKQTESIERNEYNATDEKKSEESIFEIKEEKTKEKIYISHMDDLFLESGRLIIEKNRGSVGLLQREFKIGFNRACRIMDELCEAGVVGKEIGIAPRKVLMNHDEFGELLIDGIEVREDDASNYQSNVQKDRVSKFNRIDMYNNQYDYMTGEDFELYVAQLLGNIGFYNIQNTKGSGDQGVDILAEKEGMKYAFQCKRYDKPVGNKAVQEVFAGKFFYHCHVAVVVTNNYFTQSAKELAHQNGVVLWDRDYLQNIVNYTGKYFDVKHEPQKNIGKDELTRILKEVALIIHNIFLSFNIKIIITDINYWISETEFCIQPTQGVRIKTILSYKEEIEIQLKMKVQMKAVPEKAYIGIYVSSKDLENYAKQNKIIESASNNGDWKEFEKYHEQLAQALLGIGRVYVNLFDENLNIKPYIADIQRIDEKTTKFILRCENSEQAKAIKETEGILNQGIDAEHQIEILNDIDVSLLVKFE